MSIDFSQAAQTAPLGPQSPRGSDQITRDVIVVFGGFGGLSPGPVATITPGHSTGTAELLLQLKGMAPPPLRKVFILGLEGSLPSKGGVQQGLKFISANFHPRGNIIVYGYSAGGTDALTLCRELEKQMGFFGLSSGTLCDKATADSQAKIQNFGKVRVDLLVTVDIAAGPGSARIDRVVPACVISNRNYYQTKESSIFSRGGPTSAADPKTTRIDVNQDLTGFAEHATIDEYTNDWAFQAIQQQLGVVAPAPDAPAGAALG
jgi:hypothetical protein